ncbi:uncharacterized protein LOC106463294 isoform X2 [Limulus polyphemus]|uniref:Uncharacterized protein LOC106463294 isoform X2 n=1 Tax=Limulus polyphemus TaxID=6850 RepID=A0ABM1SS50_LIMPO|nr:uncharacterized protein LOC106463294 isoform X2 [Limulus polyphemus]
MVCNICGSQGCHVGCGDVSIKMMYWECMECATVSSKVDERRSSLATPINTDVVEVESAHEVLNLETSPDKDTFGRKQQFPKEGVPTKKNKKKKKKKKKKSTSPTPTLVTLKKTKKKNSSSKDDNKLFPGKMEWTYVEQLKSFTTQAERTAEAQESSKVEKLPVTSSVQLARKKLAQESRRGNKRKRSHSRTEENSVLMCKKKKQTEPLGCKRSVIGNVGTLQDTSQTLKKKTWAFNEETLANCESSKAPLPKSLNSDNHISAHSTETSNNGCVIVKFKKSEMYFNNRLNNIESTTDNSNVEINHAKSLSIGNSKVDCTRAIETSVSQTNKTKNEETSVCRTNKTKNEKTSVCRTNKTKKKNNKDRSKFIGSDNKSSVENSNIIQTNIANTILSFKVPKKNKLLERSSVLSLQNVPCGTFNPSYSSEMKINPSVNIKSIEHIPISCKKNFSALINHEMSSLDILNQLEFKIRDSSTVGQKDSCILEVFRKENKKTGPSVKVGCYTIPLHSNCKDRCKDNNTSKKKRLLSEEQAITLMVPENRDCQLKMPQTARKSFPRTRVSFPIKLSHQKAKPKETLTYEDFIKQITRVSSSSVKEISRVKTPKSVTKSSFKKKDTCTKSKSSQIVDVSVVRKHGRKSVKKSSSNKKHYSKQLSILDFVVKSALPMFLKQQNSKDEPQPSTSSYCVSYMDGNNDTTEEVRSPPDEESHSKMIRCLHYPKDIPDIIKSHVSAGPSHQCSVPY